MIRVVLADDHTIVREGLKHLLSSTPDIGVVGEAVDGFEALQRVRELDFDVLVLDLSMPGKSGMDLIKQARSERPGVRIVVLSMHQEHQYAVRAIRAGASGYLTKESASAQLVSAIRKVAAGGAFISAEVAERLAHEAHGVQPAAAYSRLSDREYEVLTLLVSGESLTAIAARLNLSVKTISTHKARLMQKIGVDNQADLIRYAIAQGIDADPGAERPV
ncbi:MAG TPA: response regulator transcription factor [Casimicrobiaceae bacterium]|jgi:DNA-binding NarL/FixJ family response regulator